MDSATKMAYGTAGAGGASDVGTIFKITQSGKETVLHDFCSLSARDDGEIPDSTPVPDVGGNLYGTTEFGGIDGLGVVWEISPKRERYRRDRYQASEFGCDKVPRRSLEVALSSDLTYFRSLGEIRPE